MLNRVYDGKSESIGYHSWLFIFLNEAFDAEANKYPFEVAINIKYQGRRKHFQIEGAPKVQTANRK